MWPELFGRLLALLSVDSTNLDQTNEGVHGALVTLSEIINEVTDIQMPTIAPAIIPQVYRIFVDPQRYSVDLRKRAIEIFTVIVNVIAEMAEYDATCGKKYLFPYLNDFSFAMINVLSSQDPNLVDNSLKMEIIKSLSSLLKSFPKKLNAHMNNILAQIWSCLVLSSQVYVSTVVNGNSSSDDDDNDKSSLDELIYQLFEFINILKEKPRYKSTLKSAIDDLCYYAIGYMQITDDQCEAWSASTEQFVQDEDEESFSYSIRISAQELVESIAADFKLETAHAVCKTIERHMEYAQKLRAANNSQWWKIQEACLLSVSSLKPILEELSSANKLEFDLNAFVNQFVVACLHESEYPFLVGRALFTASRFSKFLNEQILETLIKATGSALQENQNAIIRVSAMKSAYNFCEELTNNATKANLLVAHLPQLAEGLIHMIMQNANNQIGSLSMETLITVLQVDQQFVASIEPKITPLAIALFLKNTNDPLVNSLITDIIKCLIGNPFIIGKVEQRLLPTLNSILNQTLTNKDHQTMDQKDLTSLLTSTLDLITMMIRSTTVVPLNDLTMSCLFPIVNLLMKSDETAILQSGGECLRAYISKSIDQVVNCQDSKGVSALNYIVLVINHMLDPKTSESGCSFIGKFINTLILHTSHVLGDNLESLLKGVLSKMQSSNVLLVQQSLIMVFAHLIHSKMDAVLTFLSNLPGPQGTPVFDFLMSEWVAKQNSFVGTYECKISILALAKLLEHAIGSDDKRFHNIYVRGDRIINPIEGIKTRSKSKGEKELYTQVPLLVKIYKILINEIHGLLEEKKDEFDTEEYDDGEDDCGDDNNGLNSQGDSEDDDDNNNNNQLEVDQNGAESLNNYLNKYDLYEDAFDKDHDGHEYGEDDPEAVDNPLMKIDLLDFLTNYLKTLSQHPCYKLFEAHHNDLEREVLKEIGIVLA
jgi:hypothetical protein